jgi:hypothetical protein
MSGLEATPVIRVNCSGNISPRSGIPPGIAVQAQVLQARPAATPAVPIVQSVLTLWPGADLQQVHIEVRPVFFPTVTT